MVITSVMQITYGTFLKQFFWGQRETRYHFTNSIYWNSYFRQGRSTGQITSTGRHSRPTWSDVFIQGMYSIIQELKKEWDDVDAFILNYETVCACWDPFNILGGPLPRNNGDQSTGYFLVVFVSLFFTRPLILSCRVQRPSFSHKTVINNLLLGPSVGVVLMMPVSSK